MHLQPVIRDARMVGGEVSERLFALGLCLPSGSNMSADDRNRVIAIVRRMSPTA
jgi:dTDP-4-amino-4,6-dideoxygalactose transaminase